ncbi:hypothetical protein ACKKBG_A29985 [Auxenochlorella protothecoides x Auxenochlorella symbiontica]
MSTSILPAHAEGEEYKVFYGLASPPTSYGGYGGNAKEDAKYTFEYPIYWKSEVVNKVSKGTQGVDGRVFNPRNKLEQAFVVTFGRAGEDNKSFKLTNIESTLAGFAGADYDLQDALTMLTEKRDSEHEIDGQKYYDVEIVSPDIRYLMTFTVNMGKVYAFLVKSPTKLWARNEESLRHIHQSFRTV